VGASAEEGHDVRARDESGQVLVLALAFMLVTGLVIGGLLTFAGTSVLGAERLREQRAAVYAADGATDAAIQVGRADTGVGGYGDARCQPPGPLAATPVLLTTTATTDDKTAATVICTWSADPLQPDRTVTFTSFVVGTATPIVRATVLYFDSGGTVPVSMNILSWTYCGHDPAICP
jgi:hypothetical protein